MTDLTAVSTALLVLGDAEQPADARIAAATELGRLGSTRAAEALAGVLRRPSPPAVQAAAATALGTIGDPGALTDLTAGLGSPAAGVRSACADALASLGLEGRVWLAEVAAGRGPSADAARTALVGLDVPGRIDGLEAFLLQHRDPARP